MTSTYHILRTSKTAHPRGAAVGVWAARLGCPAVIRTSDGAAMRTSVFGTDNIYSGGLAVSSFVTGVCSISPGRCAPNSKPRKHRMRSMRRVCARQWS